MIVRIKEKEVMEFILNSSNYILEILLQPTKQKAIEAS
jgi:hypothetical protein